MSGTEDKADVPVDVDEEAVDATEGGRRGIGGSLFHRSRSRDVNTELTPAERKRRLVYAGGGALAAAAVAVFSLRWLRGRRG